MTRKFKSKLRKALAVITLLLFSTQELLYGASIAAGSPQDGRIKIPSSLGHVERYVAGSSDKTIFFIQDAHDSIEAQVNIARMIRRAVEKHGVKTVYEEGYEGPVPTDEIYRSLHDDPTTREAVSYYLLDQMRIGGAEFAHINRKLEVRSLKLEGNKNSSSRAIKPSTKTTKEKSRPFLPTSNLQPPTHHDFKLIGADSIEEHFKNVEWFQRSVKEKASALQDLEGFMSEFQRLADERFTKQAKAYLKLKQRFDDEQIDLLSYLKRARPLASDKAVFPSIDLVLKADQADRPTIREKIKNMSTQALFEELQQLDEEVIAKMFLEKRKVGPHLIPPPQAGEDTREETVSTGDSTERRIHLSLRHLARLKRLLDFKMTPAELAAVKNDMLNFDTAAMARLLVQETNRSAVFSKTWEAAVNDAIQFYEAALQRDEAIEFQLDTFLNNTAEQTAVLVYGGFHRQSIENLLTRNGFSYYVMSPKISNIEIREQARYRKLMAEGYALNPQTGAKYLAVRGKKKNKKREAQTLPQAARVISELELIRRGGPAAMRELQQFHHSLQRAANEVQSQSDRPQYPPEYISDLIHRRLNSRSKRQPASRSEVRGESYEPAPSLQKLRTKGYSFMPLEFTDDGYVFRAVSLGVKQGITKGVFNLPDDDFKKWTQLSFGGISDVDNVNDIYFVSQDLADAANVFQNSKDVNVIDEAILVIKGSVFNQRQREKKAAVLAVGEAGMIFRYPFFAQPIPLADIAFILVSQKMKKYLDDSSDGLVQDTPLTQALRTLQQSGEYEKIQTLSLHEISGAQRPLILEASRAWLKEKNLETARFKDLVTSRSEVRGQTLTEKAQSLFIQWKSGKKLGPEASEEFKKRLEADLREVVLRIKPVLQYNADLESVIVQANELIQQLQPVDFTITHKALENWVIGFNQALSQGDFYTFVPSGGDLKGHPLRFLAAAVRVEDGAERKVSPKKKASKKDNQKSPKRKRSEVRTRESVNPLGEDISALFGPARKLDSEFLTIPEAIREAVLQSNPRLASTVEWERKLGTIRTALGVSDKEMLDFFRVFPRVITYTPENLKRKWVLLKSIVPGVNQTARWESLRALAALNVDGLEMIFNEAKNQKKTIRDANHLRRLYDSLNRDVRKTHRVTAAKYLTQERGLRRGYVPDPKQESEAPRVSALLPLVKKIVQKIEGRSEVRSLSEETKIERHDFNRMDLEQRSRLIRTMIAINSLSGGPLWGLSGLLQQALTQPFLFQTSRVYLAFDSKDKPVAYAWVSPDMWGSTLTVNSIAVASMSRKAYGTEIAKRLFAEFHDTPREHTIYGDIRPDNVQSAKFVSRLLAQLNLSQYEMELDNGEQTAKPQKAEDVRVFFAGSIGQSNVRVSVQKRSDVRNDDHGPRNRDEFEEREQRYLRAEKALDILAHLPPVLVGVASLSIIIAGAESFLSKTSSWGRAAVLSAIALIAITLGVQEFLKMAEKRIYPLKYKVFERRARYFDVLQREIDGKWLELRSSLNFIWQQDELPHAYIRDLTRFLVTLKKADDEAFDSQNTIHDYLENYFNWREGFHQKNQQAFQSFISAVEGFIRQGVIVETEELNLGKVLALKKHFNEIGEKIEAQSARSEVRGGAADQKPVKPFLESSHDRWVEAIRYPELYDLLMRLEPAAEQTPMQVLVLGPGRKRITGSGKARSHSPQMVEILTALSGKKVEYTVADGDPAVLRTAANPHWYQLNALEYSNASATFRAKLRAVLGMTNHKISTRFQAGDNIFKVSPDVLKEMQVYPVQGLFENMKLEPERYDAIIATMSLVYALASFETADEALDYFVEVVRSLKPGGKIFVDHRALSVGLIQQGNAETGITSKRKEDYAIWQSPGTDQEAQPGFNPQLFQKRVLLELEKRLGYPVAISTHGQIQVLARPEALRSEVRMVGNYSLGEAFGQTSVGPTLDGGRQDDFLYLNGKKMAVRMPWARYIYRALDNDGNEIPNRVFKITFYADQNELLFSEARMLFKLQKEPALQGVPKLLRAGMLKNGGMWIETESIANARTLENEVFGRVPRLFETLLKAGEIVKEIHARGVIHADLKPGQFLINDAQELQLIDYGNARLLGSASDRDNYTTGYVPLDTDAQPITKDLAEDTDTYSFIMMIAELLDHQIQSQSAGLEDILKPMRDRYLSLVLKSWGFQYVRELWLPSAGPIALKPRTRSQWPKTIQPVLDQVRADLQAIRTAIKRSEVRTAAPSILTLPEDRLTPKDVSLILTHLGDEAHGAPYDNQQAARAGAEKLLYSRLFLPEQSFEYQAPGHPSYLAKDAPRTLIQNPVDPVRQNMYRIDRLGGHVFVLVGGGFDVQPVNDGRRMSAPSVYPDCRYCLYQAYGNIAAYSVGLDRAAEVHVPLDALYSHDADFLSGEGWLMTSRLPYWPDLLAGFKEVFPEWLQLKNLSYATLAVKDGTVESLAQTAQSPRLINYLWGNTDEMLNHFKRRLTQAHSEVRNDLSERTAQVEALLREINRVEDKEIFSARAVSVLSQKLAALPLKQHQSVLVLGPGPTDYLPVILARLGLKVSLYDPQENVQQLQKEHAGKLAPGLPIEIFESENQMRGRTFDHVFLLAVLNPAITSAYLESIRSAAEMEDSLRVLTAKIKSQEILFAALTKLKSGSYFYVNDYVEKGPLEAGIPEAVFRLAAPGLNLQFQPQIDISDFTLSAVHQDEMREGARPGYVFHAVGARSETRKQSTKIENLTAPAGVFLDAAELKRIPESEIRPQMEEMMALLSRHKDFDIYVTGTDSTASDAIPNEMFQKLLRQYRGRIHAGVAERGAIRMKAILTQVSLVESASGNRSATAKSLQRLAQEYGTTSEIIPLEYTHAGALKGFLGLAESLKAEEIRELPARYAVRTASGYYRMAESYLTAIWQDLQNSYVFAWSA